MQLENFIQRLSAAGLDLSVVYDIGACVGDWSKHFQKCLPNSEFILFEANPFYIDYLKNTGFKYFEVALSNPGRNFVTFFNGNNTGDSYYKENTSWYETQPGIELECKTLDYMIETHNIPIPNFIKIDTQGSELDILAGASFIDRVDLIYTECPIICYNSGSPTIQDYLNFFKSKNFIPVDIFEIHRAEETLLQIDIMFVRKDIKDRYLEPNTSIRPL